MTNSNDQGINPELEFILVATVEAMAIQKMLDDIIQNKKIDREHCLHVIKMTRNLINKVNAFFEIHDNLAGLMGMHE